jgi:aspartate racemase
MTEMTTSITPSLKLPAGWLGVIGGMGPLAASDFLRKLTLSTVAQTDQQHIPTLLYGDCTTPDRTASVLGEGPSPLAQLLAAVDFLNAAGVQVIAMPCNSAHCWHENLVERANMPVLHIVDASAQQVLKRNPHASVVGVLSTEGTARMGIYTQRLTALGLEPLTPSDEDFRDLVSPGITCVKAGDLKAGGALLRQAAHRLFDRGAHSVILGCTEIPLGMTHELETDPVRFIDSTQSLVEATLAHLRP